MSDGYDSARKVVARHLNAMFQELAEGVVNEYPQWNTEQAVDALSRYDIWPIWPLEDLVNHLRSKNE